MSDKAIARRRGTITTLETYAPPNKLQVGVYRVLQKVSLGLTNYQTGTIITTDRLNTNRRKNED